MAHKSGKVPYSRGVHLSYLTPKELGLAAKLSLMGSASGIVLFTGNKMDETYWKYMGKEFINQ